MIVTKTELTNVFTTHPTRFIATSRVKALTGIELAKYLSGNMDRVNAMASRTAKKVSKGVQFSDGSMLTIGDVDRTKRHAYRYELEFGTFYALESMYTDAYGEVMFNTCYYMVVE